MKAAERCNMTRWLLLGNKPGLMTRISNNGVGVDFAVVCTDLPEINSIPGVEKDQRHYLYILKDKGVFKRNDL